MKYILGTLILGMLMSISGSKDEIEQEVTAKFIYTTKRCDYDVYKAQAGGHIGCNDWDFYKTIRPGNKATIVLYPGDEVVVRIVESGAEACAGASLKKQANLSLRSNATQSSSHSEELHDWDCD